MKKLTYLLLLSISLLSCSESSNNEPKDEQLFDVSFNVSTFKQDITDMKSAQALSGATEQLAYYVFNENNEFLYVKQFYTSDGSFDKVNDKLPEGIYNIVFFAHNGSSDSSVGDGFFKGEDEKNPTIFTGGWDYDLFGDSFHKKITINVPDDNSDMSVALDRVVGKLEIIFTDNMPNEVTNIEYSLTGTYWGLDLFNTSPIHQETITKEVSISDDVRGKPNYRLEFYSFVGGEVGTVNSSITIKCFDVDNNVVASKTITNMDIFRNKITRLSGEMFSSTKDNENSFSLTVDTDWSEIIEKDFEDGKDVTSPAVNFTSPSTNSSSPTTITAGQTVVFTANISDNEALKSIIFSNLIVKNKSVSDFIQDFNSELLSAKPNEASIAGKSTATVDFSVDMLVGVPAGVYTLSCSVTDESDNSTIVNLYFEIE